MAWGIRFEDAARRQYDALDGPIRERITRALVRLAADPLRVSGVKALTGGGYRLRVGDWRVVYDLYHDVVVVVVIRIGHRRDVYR